MTSPRALLGLFALATAIATLSPAALLGCSSSSSPPSPPATLNDGLPATCNPLRVNGGECLFPFPDAIYLTADSTTKTGYRVDFPIETLPTVNAVGTQLDPTPYNRADGFSPSTPILYYFTERIDPKSLVSIDDARASVAPGASTVVYDMDAKALVAHFAEVDDTVNGDDDRQAMMIRPLARLAPGHRYAVAITKSIQTLAGGLPTAPPYFARIAAGNPPADAMSQAQAARMPDVLAALAAAGVQPSNLLVAWDFVTGSDEYLTSHVLTMRDAALAAAGTTGLGYTITSVENNLDAKVLRRIRGTFTVPMYLTQNDPKVAAATLTVDATGKPIQNGTYQAPFTILVPAMASTAKGPLPLMQFGHGLFGSAETELGDASGSYMQDFIQAKGYIVFGTDWTGLSVYENPVSTSGSGAAGQAILDFNHLTWITDRLQQSIVNAIVLTRTMNKIATDPAMTTTGAAGGAPLADPTKLYYYGISLGGIMGGSFMGYGPDIKLGVLGVPGGNWSTLFQRSSNWRLFKLVIGGSYPDFLDQQELLALAQMHFDFSDPATVAPHILASPLAGVPAKQILMQMAVGDAQVPNIATYAMARTEGVPLLAETDVSPYGLTPVAGPQPVALTTWDIQPTPFPPETNATPTADNGAHDLIRMIPQLEDQLDQFLRTGTVVSTCQGACVFPGFNATP